MPMHRAGDWVTILSGPGAGETREITHVRMFATDNGYHLRGGDGLYGPRQVALARERTDGNPCGAPCSERSHNLIGTCDHCRGACICHLRPPRGTE